MLISIIIPVYNVEKFLEKCLQSVFRQTYSNIEIILVDDGSTDNSGKLCDDLSEGHKNVKVIHKDNGGLSSARNTGIEAATGDALFFLDSDDYLSPNCIERCADLMKKYNSDIAIIQMLYILENTNREVKTDIVAEELFTTQQAIEASLYQIKFSCCTPAKLYKKNVIGDIRFPVGRLSEDLATCHLFLNKAEKIIYTDEIGYYYRQRNKSIMHEFSPQRLDALEWAHKIKEFCENRYPAIVDAAICRTFNVAIHLLMDLQSDTEMHKRFSDILWKDIIHTRKSVICNPKVRKREKIAALLSYFGENVLVAVWNSKLAVKRRCV